MKTSKIQYQAVPTSATSIQDNVKDPPVQSAKEQKS